MSKRFYSPHLPPLSVRGGALLMTISAATLHPAQAQQPGIEPVEAMIDALPLINIAGFATIDAIALSFALLAAILSLRTLSNQRRAVAENAEGLAMSSATAQIEPSRSNLERLIERIRVAEKPNAEILLDSGVKLLAAEDEPRRLVGVAALEVVSLGEDPDLAVAAMERLADHMQAKFRHSHEGEECRVTAEALCKAGMMGRSCDRTLTFAAAPEEYDNDDSAQSTSNVKGNGPSWQLVGGVKISRYLGGRIEGQIINAGPGDHSAVWCSAVRLVDCIIIDDAFGASCVLSRCRIMRYNPERPFISELVQCDFSGCLISPAALLTDLRDHGCWYDPAEPPQGDQPIKWPAFLHQGDPGDQSSWKMRMENNMVTQQTQH
jgi:hypothetical protein